MNAVLFAAHNDDETLWSFTNILRHRPHVIIVLRSFVEASQGGPSYETREAETDCAMKVAGVEWDQWLFPDTHPDWNYIAQLVGLEASAADTVIAPAFEAGGHEHHNALAQIVPHADIRYLSYVRGHGRSTNGIEVIPTAEEAALKRSALACYASQAAFPPTAAWFGEDQREVVV